MNTRHYQTIAVPTLALLLAALAGSAPVSADDGILAQGNAALKRIEATIAAGPTATQRVEQLKSSLEGAHMAPKVARNAPVEERPKTTGWALPDWEIEPLIDPTVLFFSFDR